MRIARYQAQWHIHQNVGRIRIELEGQSGFHLLPVNNSAEFVAILSLLQSESDSYMRNGWLGTNVAEDWV